ncbi:SDR family NAD(P)-dependent oxidoreductase [Micromonosporaceae bacterium B7E4]
MRAPLSGRRALIVGGGRGIGAATALELARQGARVVVAARSAGELHSTVEIVRQEGGWAEAVVADIGDPTAASDLVSTAARLAGGLDTLVNCAGLFEPKPFLECSDDDWLRHMDVNLLAVVRVTRAALPLMLAAGYGRVVTVASTAGKYGSPGQSPYNASKHAVVGLTKCLAVEVAGQGVTVNAVCPGYVNTRLLDRDDFRAQQGIAGADRLEEVLSLRIPIKRLVRAEEVAHLCAYLCTAQAASITGQALTIAGGMLLI